MKIILEYENEFKSDTTSDTAPIERRIIIQSDSEFILDVLNDIKGALIAYGFHENTVKEGIIELANELKGEE